ncbi:unnamed protein product [Staurois parvus]|uniref:Uncharacterized protein n=1 Tax=Staurois parvus TaxID=386267 RepID=A0ABN9D4Q8_9NEOB|nr:unnamed protein product [Staurois parvus]
MSAVDLRIITAHFTHPFFGQSRGQKTRVWSPQSLWLVRLEAAARWEAIQHPMTKMETLSSVRRP